MAQIHCALEGQTAVLRYDNRPSGYMNSAGANALNAAMKKAVAMNDVRVVVITGVEDGVFVRHYDIGELVAVAEALKDGAVTARQFEHAPFVDLTDQIAASPKPVIAAINGVCLGGGFELALACDIRIAGKDVREIGLPETRVGIFPGAGGTQRLPRLIGEGRALDFILNGAIVDAANAERLGLVTATAVDPVIRALEMAEELAAKPAAGLAMAKRLVRSAFDCEAMPGLLTERRTFADLLRTDEAALTRMRHFVEEGRPIADSR
ncbi:MAG: enoyl-CoA hydratase/isomerase family protein [Hyphomonadaceae bacterium]